MDQIYNSRDKKIALNFSNIKHARKGEQINYELSAAKNRIAN